MKLRSLRNALALAFLFAPSLGAQAGSAALLPARLADTGLYVPDGGTRVRDGIVEFSPQYPLWSDGAHKRRWLSLPAGTAIDASRPDAWEFPRGTRLWKEFSYAGRPVETRFIERRDDGSWSFAVYVWDEQGKQAVLAPERGITALPVATAPGGRYAIPARGDCLACHGSTPVPVLGVSALQLSPDRDPLAPGASPSRPGQVDMRALVARGWLQGLPTGLLERPPRIAASNPLERATLGYLHGNCAHCHNTSDLRVPLELTLAQRTADPGAARHEVLRSLVLASSRYRPHGAPADTALVKPGQPHDSVLAARMQSRNPLVQMPPLGTSLPDPEGLALVQRWISQLSIDTKEPQP